MANPVSNEDISRYFSSAEAFSVIRKKALFALKTARWEGRSEEEIRILRALSEVSESEENFLQSLKAQIISFDSDRINFYVRSLISPASEAAKPIRSKRPSLKIEVPASESGGSLELNSPLCLDSSPLYRKRVYQMMEEMRQAPRFSSPSYASMKGRGVLRSNSQIEKKVDDFARPCLHARSATFRYFESSSIYPKELLNQKLLQNMVEGASIMKYLFYSAYEKNFPKREDREVIDRLFNHYFRSKWVFTRGAVLLDLSFKELFEKKRDTVLRTFAKLNAKQSISKLSKPSEKFTLERVPQLLRSPPFNDPKQAIELIDYAGNLKYVFLGIYQVDCSKEEREFIEILLHASLLMEYLRYNLETALRYVLPHFEPVKEAAVEAFVKKYNRRIEKAPIESAVSDSEKQLKDCLESHLYFQDPALFAFMIEYIRALRPKLNNFCIRSVADILVQMHERLKNEPISLRKALSDTFSLNGLSRLFVNNDPIKNIEQFHSAIKQLVPAHHLKHEALESEAKFKAVCQAACRIELNKKWTPYQQKAIERLRQLQSETLRWDLAIQLYLNNEALRELFDRQNDQENILEMSSCFTLLLTK